VFVFVLIGAYSLISTGRLDNSQFAGAWFPVFLVFAASLAVLGTHLSRLQPVDLSPWLERDRANSPHTVLFYREALQAREFLNSRRRTQRGTVTSTQLLNYVRIAVMLVLSVTGSFYIIETIRFPDSLWSNLQILVPIVFLLLFLVYVRGSNMQIVPGFSLMSLISMYREFAEKAVYRIRQGALGERNASDFEVVVCIDELDKIVELDELRIFLRRMKAIFEIPGVYYYLSLSEDALRSLYLGAAEGKNEVDSAFDHIVRIPPLDAETGAQIAAEYIRKHTTQMDHANVEKISRTIAAVSFGVPRDIIRRCDELLAEHDIAQTPPGHVSDDFRRRQAELAYGESLLTKREFSLFASESTTAAQEIGHAMENGLSDGRSAKIMLSLWVLSLISLVSQRDGDSWRETIEKLRDIGYRIPEEPAANLSAELRQIQDAVLMAQPE
jgi:hypothetical protein